MPVAEAMKLALSITQGLSAFHDLHPPMAFRDLKVWAPFSPSPFLLGLLLEI